MSGKIAERTRELVAEALDIAIMELEYRIADLSDTGDYAPEDVERMQKTLAGFEVLRDSLDTFIRS